MIFQKEKNRWWLWICLISGISLWGWGIEGPETPSPNDNVIVTPSFYVQKQSSTPYQMDGSQLALPIVLKELPRGPFGIGEELTFQIEYEFVPAGKATLKIEKGLDIDGRSTINFISTARTNDFFDGLFKVRDLNSSQVDELSLASLSFHQNIREGRYRVIRNMAVDYKTGKYRFEKQYKGKYKTKEGVVDRPVLDVLGAFFFIRSLPLVPGTDIYFEIFNDDGVFSARVAIHPKTQKIRVPAGEFECLKVTPYISGDAIFKSRGGQMTIYLTNDERKVPVLLSSDVFIGSFDAELVTYKPPLK